MGFLYEWCNLKTVQILLVFSGSKRSLLSYRVFIEVQMCQLSYSLCAKCCLCDQFYEK